MRLNNPDLESLAMTINRTGKKEKVVPVRYGIPTLSTLLKRA